MRHRFRRKRTAVLRSYSTIPPMIGVEEAHGSRRSGPVRRFPRPLIGIDWHSDRNGSLGTASNEGACVNNAPMISTNLPELVYQLQQLGDVRVMDRLDTIELHVATTSDLEAVDDLVCDALFVDPLGRKANPLGCILELAKRDTLRHSSDMRVLDSGSAVRYSC